jgi:hypothetical protein
VICKKIDGRGNHHIKPNRSHWERQILHDFSQMCNLDFLNDMQVEGKLFRKWKGKKEGRQEGVICRENGIKVHYAHGWICHLKCVNATGLNWQCF